MLLQRLGCPPLITWALRLALGLVATREELWALTAELASIPSFALDAA